MSEYSTESNRDEIAYEFYVSSGSKDLIRHLSGIMRRQGYIGYADGGGRMHYVVDGSQNLYETAGRIRTILREREEDLYEEALELRKLRKQLRTAAETVLDRRGFKPTLKGYLYLRALLEALAVSEDSSLKADKALYLRLCEEFQTGRKQMDRVISYSLNRAGIKLCNSEAIALLAEEARTEFRRLKRGSRRSGDYPSPDSASGKNYLGNFK